MKYSNWFLCIRMVLFGCYVYAVDKQYTCQPESSIRHHTETHHGSSHGSIGSYAVTVLTETGKRTVSSDKCKTFLTIHGKYGTSLPTPISLATRQQHIVLPTFLGDIKLVTLSQSKTEESACPSKPKQLSILNFDTNFKSNFSCTVSNMHGLHRTRRSVSRVLAVKVKTGTWTYAGTDANIWIRIYGKTGSTGDIPLRGSFESGDTDIQNVIVDDIGVIRSLHVHHDEEGAGDGWHLDWIEISESKQRTLHFDYNDWADPGATLYPKNACGDIQYCQSQLCDTCHTCDTSRPWIYLTPDERSCSQCPSIMNCDQRKCSSSYDVVCTKCNDQGSTISRSVYWPDPSNKSCLLTCSWKSQWCWPGRCGNYLPSSCVCEKGFRKVASTTSCDLSTNADLLTCKMSVRDSRGEIRQTRSGTNSTNCSSETDVFINIKPTSVSFHLTSSFTREGSTTEPSYIIHGSTKLGIVDGNVSLSQKDTSGSSSSITSINLLSSATPSDMLDCSKNISFTSYILNGQWICARIVIFSGGSFILNDYIGTRQGTKHFTPVEENKTLCFKYDDEPPVHCSATTSCMTSPLHLSTRLTISGNITVSVSGWSDPFPLHGTPDQASGVDFYLLEVFKMNHLNNKTLTVDFTASVFQSQQLQGPDHNITLNLPDEPSMYAVYLEVHDVAGNVRYARRFVIYDKSSTIKVRDDNHLCVVSASKESNFKWQTHHGNIEITWKNRFYNNFTEDYLTQIVPDTVNNVVGIYEQTTGIPSANAITTVNGVTSFLYSWALSNGTRTPWAPIPDFTNQSLSLDLNVTDGETYMIWIMAQDILGNDMVESKVVHIDTTVASITDIKLGLLKPVKIMFQVYDTHSGISSVDWTLEAPTNVSTGTLAVIKSLDTQDCEATNSCYCPAVGSCEFSNYSLILDTDMLTSADQTFCLTIYVTNGAHLNTSIELCVTIGDIHAIGMQTKASLPTGGPTAPSAGFAERHDLDCSAGVMHIHLPLSLFPTHSVTLRDPTCKVTSNGTHLVTDIGLNQCGTTVTFTNDSVIFNNDLLATASNNPGATVATIIDFGLNSADQRVPVSCIFPRESRLDFGYIPLQRTAHFYEKQYGHLDFEVRHYQTEQYRTLVPNTGLPVGVPLNTEVFIDLFVDQTNHKGVGIFVDSCIATPTTNPADPLWYPLVKDGCPMQADVRTFTTPDVNEFRFSFLAFKFTRAPLQKPAPSLPPSPMVYLHCQVSACPSGNCSTSCHSPSTRTRRSADQQKSHLISTGPFYLKTDDHDQEGYSTAVVVATMSVAAVATLVAMVAIVAWRRSANKLSKYRASTMDVTS